MAGGQGGSGGKGGELALVPGIECQQAAGHRLFTLLNGAGVAGGETLQLSADNRCHGCRLAWVMPQVGITAVVREGLFRHANRLGMLLQGRGEAEAIGQGEGGLAEVPLLIRLELQLVGIVFRVQQAGDAEVSGSQLPAEVAEGAIHGHHAERWGAAAGPEHVQACRSSSPEAASRSARGGQNAGRQSHE